MLQYFKQLSVSRSAWFLIILSATLLEGVALYFQHGMGLAPCVMCIYERVALFVILFAGIIGFIAPSIALIRWLALLLGTYSAAKGLMLAIKHTDYQLNPAPWNQCSPFVDFPPTLPLNEWFPQIFAPSGDCSKISWAFLGLSMAQWLIVIFAIYLLIFGIVIISQFKKHRTQGRRSIFH